MIHSAPPCTVAMFGPIFAFGAVGLCALGFMLPAPTAWLAWWSATTCGIVAAAWLGIGPPPYGKRPDGSRSVWSTIALFPFLATIWTYWHVRRPLREEPPYHDLLPDLVIGRRLLASEFTLEVQHVVDLTCEYSERPEIRRHPGYRCLPILDGSSPSGVVLEHYVETLRRLHGRVFLHCAEGHGRTSLVAAALLLARNEARDPEEAFAKIAAVRPKARPYASQRRALQRFWRRASLAASGEV